MRVARAACREDMVSVVAAGGWKAPAMMVGVVAVGHREVGVVRHHESAEKIDLWSTYYCTYNGNYYKSIQSSCYMLNSRALNRAF